ncbi:MAG: frnE protein [Robiginitomaculum sp.]|nr:MAG: frnE protein [Robiginitomaculum sp.]
MASHTIIIDIVSDIVCPWCWLGKQYLDAAVTNSPEIDVEINWHPFMLDPDITPEGVGYKDYMRKKFGSSDTKDASAGRFKSMRTLLENAATPAGIHFNFDDISIRPNSMKAHLLMKWAGGQGKAHLAAEALFKAFFEMGQDVGKIETLTKIADTIGMDAELVDELLRSDRDIDTIQNALAFFNQLGIHSVPTFIYNGEFAVQGGQLPEVHTHALQRASELETKSIFPSSHS